MIAATTEELDLVRRIIRARFPTVGAWVFGSRCGENHKPYSDLDIALRADERLPRMTLARLREDLMTAPLRYRVDIIDYQTLSDGFRAGLDSRHEVLLERFDKINCGEESLVVSR